MKKLWYACLCLMLLACDKKSETGKTTIYKWPFNKTGAVSITYDDGIRTQFSKALPIMKQLHLPATFFIITGAIPGSQFKPRFIGRPVKEIIHETADIVTDSTNFFERASAVRYLGYKGALDCYNETDRLFERGKRKEAYTVLDDFYSKVRSGKLKPGTDTSMEFANEDGLSWEDVKKYAAQGYEFASHTVSHAHLAILDTANMLYELEKSKADMFKHLGIKYTFSAEVPFGIEDPRVMKTALPVYPALRNIMPDTFMKEINRGYKEQPGAFDKEYIQWQRGPLSKTPLSKMKSWIDTTVAHDNIWLVLVFHGIDSVGWEPLTSQILATYFKYIKQHEDSLWVASFGDVARYIRERMNAAVRTEMDADTIKVTLTHTLDSIMYNHPLTLKTYIPRSWKAVSVTQGKNIPVIKRKKDRVGDFIEYQAIPNTGTILIYSK